MTLRDKVAMALSIEGKWLWDFWFAKDGVDITIEGMGNAHALALATAR